MNNNFKDMTKKDALKFLIENTNFMIDEGARCNIQLLDFTSNPVSPEKYALKFSGKDILQKTVKFTYYNSVGAQGYSKVKGKLIK